MEQLTLAHETETRKKLLNLPELAARYDAISAGEPVELDAALKKLIKAPGATAIGKGR